MRTLLLVAVVVLLLSIAVPCVAQTFTLDPVTNCPGLGYSVNIGLTGPFTYHIQYVSGAWSPVPDDSYYGGFTWSGKISWYQYGSGQYGSFGPTTYYTSAADAEAASQNVYTLVVPNSGAVSFYLEELGPTAAVCNDNRGSVTLKFVFPTPVGEQPNLRTELLATVPNPFNPATAVRFTLAQRDHVRIDVYDIAGKFVRNLVDDVRPAGLQQAAWNGTDANDRHVASGVYFIRLSTRDENFTRKMVLLK